MKRVFAYLSSLASVVKPLAIAAACALVIFSSATPAFAFGNSNSQPSKGLEQLDGVQKESEQAISGQPDVNTKKAQRGLNSVQGKANKKDMISPNDANGNSIEENIENALDDIKN